MLPNLAWRLRRVWRHEPNHRGFANGPINGAPRLRIRGGAVVSRQRIDGTLIVAEGFAA